MPSFLCGILYCTDAGLYFLDVIDFYVNFVMLLVGFLESFGAAWAYGILEQYRSVGVKATISYMMSNFVPVIVLIGFWSSSYDQWVAYVSAVAFWQVGLLVTHYFLVQRMERQPGRWTYRSIWFECAFGNISRLRDQIQPVIGYIPFIWVILIKNLVPHACILLFFNLLLAPTGQGAGTYGDFAIRPYQLLGLLTFIFAIFLFFVGLLVPEVYEPLAVPQTKVVLSGLSEMEEKEKDDIESSERGSLPSIGDFNGDEEI